MSRARVAIGTLVIVAGLIAIGLATFRIEVERDADGNAYGFFFRR